MATIFERIGNSVKISTAENVYIVPAVAVIFPDPRESNVIIISDTFNVQNEKDGLRINVDDVSGISFTDRNDLITQLAEGFFFNQIITTPEGGIAMRLINKTGAQSVKGTLVSASSVPGGFDITPANGLMPFGAVYDNAVADGDYCYVCFAGIVQVLLQNSTTSAAGYWAKVSDTAAGRADITNPFPAGGTINALEDHNSEIGHCIETVASGTNKLAKIVMHFN